MFTPPVSDSKNNIVDEAPPVFYTVLLFVQGFGRAFFLNHFNWIMRSKPNFGEKTYGFLSPYCVEHTYVMHRDLRALENGGFKNNPYFSDYTKAVEKVPQNYDVKKGGSAYFERFPKIFVNQFRFYFDKHILSHWTDEKHLVYMIAGHSPVQKAFLQYLSSFDEEDNNGESIILFLHHSSTSY
jgi:hypothetical protein